MILPFDEQSIAIAASALQRGELVAFPTETVYGLGARADQSEAVRRIYEAKGRPAENPSIVHVLDADAAFALAEHVTDDARAFARTFWPGPLTLVLTLKPGAVASEVTAGGATVAVRAPAHPAARALLAACGLPIAAPSANRSTHISPTTALHVEKSLGKHAPLILDAGPTGFGIESTIVDTTVRPARILRRGSISLEELARVAEVIDEGSLVTPEGERALAPGTQARHYAPSVPVVVTLAARAAEAVAEHARAGRFVGLVALGDPVALATTSAKMEVLGPTPFAYGRDLYAALHRLEDAKVDVIIVVEPPATADWEAIRDRLTRAR